MAKSTTFADLKVKAARFNNDRTDDKAISINENAIQDALRNLAVVSDWTFLRSRFRLVTDDQTTTGAINLSLNSNSWLATSNSSSVVPDWSSITSLGSTWTVKVNGEDIDYDISSTGTSAVVPLTSKYVGTANLTRASYKLFRRSYDLPADFREMIGIVDVRRPHHPLIRVSHSEMLELNLGRSGGSTPDRYSIENKTGDTVRQLWLYPYPTGSTKFQYDLIYQRWPDNPTTGTDTIDWPNDLMPLLESAVYREIALENKDMEAYQLADSDYADKLEVALSGDVEDSADWFIGMGRVGPRGLGSYIPFHKNVTDLSS